MSTIDERLDRLPRHLRTAFAAACAERVLPVYEFDGYEEDDDSLERASEIVWKAACGVRVEPRALDIMEQAVRDVTPSADDEPGFGPSIYSALTVLGALQAVEDETSDSAKRAGWSERDAYASVAQDKQEGARSEQAWQERALDLLESWGDKPVTRDMFEPLGDPPVELFPE
jgi:hypothetical protein